MESLQARRAAIKSKMAVAKTQERMNKMGSSIAGVGQSMSALRRMEEKANRLLDEASALSQLITAPQDSMDDLMAKYDSPSGGEDSAVDDELAALKEKMGL